MISGVGGLGAAAPAGLGGLGLSGLGLNGGLNGPLQGLTSASLTGAATLRMQQLTQLIEGFSSAEILLALMIASALQKRCKDDDDSSPLAMLAAMALAGRLANNLGGLSGGLPGGGLEIGGVGGNLNVTA
jgi:hypothetical protein